MFNTTHSAFSTLVAVAALGLSFAAPQSADAASYCEPIIDNQYVACVTDVDNNTMNVDLHTASNEFVLNLDITCEKLSEERFSYEYEGRSELTAKDTYDFAGGFCEGWLF